MTLPRINAVLAVCLLGAGLGALSGARPAFGSPFTTFAEDEDACRKAGTEAIGGTSGPTAERRYDVAYRRCMMFRGRMRRMPSESGPPGLGFADRNPHSFDFPDAYYSIPYATPGYGYDGYGY